MNPFRYKDFTIADFLNDDHFINWCIDPTPESETFWNQFIKEYPEKENDTEQAREVIHVCRQQKVYTNEDRAGAVLKRIEESINTPQQVKGKIFKLSILLKIAATVLLAAATGLALWLYQNKSVMVATTYGQIRTIHLPDQSTVTLNGNSTISYSKNWRNKIREVWITGEGLFKVKHINKDVSHIKSGERFIVHCRNLNIEVLGTTFNLKERHDKTDIILINGKIMIDYLDDNRNEHVKGLVMRPGEFIEYSRQHITTRSKVAQPQSVTKWVDHPLWFANAKLSDVTEVLEDNYGYEVTFTDNNIADEKIGGEINVADVNQLLETISTTLHVTIKKTENHIIISPSTPN